MGNGETTAPINVNTTSHMSAGIAVRMILSIACGSGVPPDVEDAAEIHPYRGVACTGKNWKITVGTT